MNVADIVALDDWVERGKTEEDKKSRAERMQKKIFPEGLAEVEVQKRQQLVALARVEKLHRHDAEDPMPGDVVTELVNWKSKPLEWEGLISSNHKAYKRGSLHDGTQAEVDKMRRHAQGSPFDADD